MNSLRGTATSASGKNTYFECRATFAPIFTNFSHQVVPNALGQRQTVWTRRGPVTYYILFFLHLHTRRVHLAGMTPNRDPQQRNLG